ncbi:hypothetical protein IMSAG049_01526 [Clostridiales bacterium]|nr:hypothetical protein IMSAG049_01526 [Clostridiales bacterium]
MKTVKKACVFIGMVVGAGFASGREIADYFLVFGENWKIGIAFSGLLFFLVIAATIGVVERTGAKSYKKYLLSIMGDRLAIFTEWVSGIFFFVMFFAMTAASGSAATEMFRIDSRIGIAFTLIVCASVIYKGMDALELISVALVPLLVAGIALIGAKCGTGEIVSAPKCGSVILSAVIYVSYNTITAASVTAYSEEKQGNGLLTGALCGLAMTIMGYIIGYAVLSKGAIDAEIPFAFAAKALGGAYFFIYAIVFCSAVLTTAICDGVAAVAFVREKLKIGKGLAICMLIAAAAVFSVVRFSDFVSKIYPIFGFVGVLQLLSVFSFYIRRK